MALDFSLTYAVRLVPMGFREPDVSAGEADSGDSFHFPPSAFAVTSPQALEITNAPASGDGFNNGDIANDLDIPPEIVPLRAMSL